MTTVEVSELHPEHPETTGISSLPSANVDTDTPPIASENPEFTHEDPQVAALQAMFPDFDTTILHTVLESVSGDQDRAVDVLLGMSDPSYQSTARPDAAQTDLDEEFARNLMLEEQSRRQPAWRPRSTNDPTNQVQGSSTNDSVAQIQEQLGKFAESGKRTLGTLFSKVKAKIQELDNPSNEPSRFSGSPQVVTAQSPPQPAFQPSQVTLESTRSPSGNEPYNTRVTSNESYSTEPPSVSLNPSIGLLPRRPVALNSSPQPSSAGVADNDELEYVTNPFEESERK